MKTRSTLAVLLLGVAAFANADCIFASGFDVSTCPPATTVEFAMNQNLSGETVTCADYLAVYDFSQYGHIDGTGCKATGPLLPDNGTLGNVSVSFQFTDGTAGAWSGCRIDDMSAMPGYVKFTINCT